MRRSVWKVMRLVGILLLTLIIISPCIYGVILLVLDMPNEIRWRDNTSPLNSEVVRDLCQKFNIGNRDPRCHPGATVYAPEFFKIIRQDFIPSAEQVVTYDYVQAKIGKYQYECGPLVKEQTGAEYFQCNYDFQGDRVFPIGIAFDSTGKIWRFFASTTD